MYVVGGGAIPSLRMYIYIPFFPCFTLDVSSAIVVVVVAVVVVAAARCWCRCGGGGGGLVTMMRIFRATWYKSVGAQSETTSSSSSSSSSSKESVKTARVDASTD